MTETVHRIRRREDEDKIEATIREMEELANQAVAETKPPALPSDLESLSHELDQELAYQDELRQRIRDLHTELQASEARVVDITKRVLRDAAVTREILEWERAAVDNLIHDSDRAVEEARNQVYITREQVPRDDLQDPAVSLGAMQNGIRRVRGKVRSNLLIAPPEPEPPMPEPKWAWLWRWIP